MDADVYVAYVNKATIKYKTYAKDQVSPNDFGNPKFANTMGQALYDPTIGKEVHHNNKGQIIYDSLIYDQAKDGPAGTEVYVSRHGEIEDATVILTQWIYNENGQRERKDVEQIQNFNKHNIIIVDATDSYDFHHAVYEEVNAIVDALSYDFLQVNGTLPMVNLIGHSRGGVVNIMYATKHPYNVSSVYSIDTPYRSLVVGAVKNTPGADDALRAIEEEIFGFYSADYSEGTTPFTYMLTAPGAQDFLNYNVIDGTMEAWNAAVAEAASKGHIINAHAIGSAASGAFLWAKLQPMLQKLKDMLDSGSEWLSSNMYGILETIEDIVGAEMDEGFEETLSEILSAVAVGVVGGTVVGLLAKALKPVIVGAVIFTVVSVAVYAIFDIRYMELDFTPPVLRLLSDYIDVAGEAIALAADAILDGLCQWIDISESFKDSVIEQISAAFDRTGVIFDGVIGTTNLVANLPNALCYIMANLIGFENGEVVIYDDIFIDLDSQLATGFDGFNRFYQIHGAATAEVCNEITLHNYSHDDEVNIAYIADDLKAKAEAIDDAIAAAGVAPVSYGGIDPDNQAGLYNIYTSLYDYEQTDIEGEIRITGYDGDLSSGRLLIPTYLNGYPVVEISPTAFCGNTSIEYLYIGANILTLREGTFAGCVNLNTIIFEDGRLLNIEPEVFKGDTSIAYINAIPSKVTYIGYDNFAQTPWLTAEIAKLSAGEYFRVGEPMFETVAKIVDNTVVEVVVETKAVILAYKNNVKDYELILDGGKRIAGDFTVVNEAVGSEMGRIKKLIIRDAVYFEYAFKGMAFSELVIDYEKTEGNKYGVIPKGAFENCTGIVSVVLGANVIYIDDDAFLGCTGLDVIYVMDGALPYIYDIDYENHPNDIPEVRTFAKAIEFNYELNGQTVVEYREAEYMSMLTGGNFPNISALGYNIVWRDAEGNRYSAGSAWTKSAQEDWILTGELVPIYYNVILYMVITDGVNWISDAYIFQYTVSDTVVFGDGLTSIGYGLSDFETEGYEFLGFYWNGDTTKTIVTGFGAGNTGDMEYTALYKAEQYKLEVKTNANDESSAVESYYFEFGEYMSIKGEINSWKGEGYTYTYRIESSDEAMLGEEGIWSVAGDVRYSIVWTPIEYTATFVNGETHRIETTFTVESGVSSATFAQIEEEMKQNSILGGLIFNGWKYYGELGGGITCGEIPKGRAGNVILQAQWRYPVVSTQGNTNITVTLDNTVLDFAGADATKIYSVTVAVTVRSFSLWGNANEEYIMSMTFAGGRSYDIYMKNMRIKGRVTLTGSGTGATAINAGNAIGIKIYYTGACAITGGAGGNGVNGTTAGSNGGNGGAGGKAIDAKALSFGMIGTGSLAITGGAGGNGGNGAAGTNGINGGKGANVSGNLFKPKNGENGGAGGVGGNGGNGGNGGSGGYAISCASITVDDGSVNLYATGGAGGSGGNGGNGGKGGNGGAGGDDNNAFIIANPGNGGNGGNGGAGGNGGSNGTGSEAISMSGTAPASIVKTKGASGHVGQKGNGGAGGSGGAGGDKGAVGSNGSNGSNGSTGASGNNGALV
jgi:predicted alpha/beta hydrolase family esterase